MTDTDTPADREQHSHGYPSPVGVRCHDCPLEMRWYPRAGRTEPFKHDIVTDHEVEYVDAEEIDVDRDETGAVVYDHREQAKLVTDGGRPANEASQSDSEQTRVGHTKADPTDVYAGRGRDADDMFDVNPGYRGWLGNPFTLDGHDREESIRRFRRTFEWRLEADDEFREAVRALAGKTLGCWCQRLDEDGPACHAEVIAEHADRLAAEEGGQ